MSSYFKLLKSVWADVLAPAGSDLMRSAPDNLFLGTSIFALLTQNFALGVLVVAMAEFGLLNRLLGGFIGAVQDNRAVPHSDVCLPGIPSPLQISAVGTLLTGYSFPSGPTFFMSATLMYIFSSIQNFNEELSVLGQREPDWTARKYMSMVFSIILILAFMVYRLMNSCEPIFTAMGSVILGSIAGVAIFTIHLYVFGREGVNFLGLPQLTNRFTPENPLQVCAKLPA
jgi:membrane-associated phospholipid phosphatase